MNVNDEIKDILASKTQEELKTLVKEYRILQNTGVLPPNSEYSKLTTKIGELFNMRDYHISLTLTYITDEVFNRFLNQ